MRVAWTGISQPGANPVVVGRHFCCRCGHWRLVCDFAALAENESGLRGYCRTCERVWRQRRQRERGDSQMLQTGPLLALLWRHRAEHLVDHETFSWDRFAEDAGVCPRRLRALLNGETKRVRVVMADHLACAVGMPLSLLYPYEEAA